MKIGFLLCLTLGVIICSSPIQSRRMDIRDDCLPPGLMCMSNLDCCSDKCSNSGASKSVGSCCIPTGQKCLNSSNKRCCSKSCNASTGTCD